MAGSLPADVLVELFRLIPQPEQSYDPYYSLFDAAGVNRNWRTAATECGPLWSCIRTKERRDRRLLPLLLERSGTSPLDVRLDLHYPGERAAVIHALLPHVGRIQKLYIRHLTLQPDSQDTETILQLVDAGLEFTLLTEYIHEHKEDDFEPSAESDTPLNFTAPKLLAACIDGTRPRTWSTFLARTLVELDISSQGTPLDLDLLALIFQQCGALVSLTLSKGLYETHAPLLPPGPHRHFIPPPSLSALDLHMPMPDILAILGLFSGNATLESITVCDGEGLRKMTLPDKSTQPILEHMLRGLSSVVAFEVHSDQDVVIRDADSRTRRFRVEAEDDECYETGALWSFLVARFDAQRTVRTLLGTTAAWNWLARPLELHPMDPPADNTVELQIILNYNTQFQEFCDSGYYPPLNIAALKMVTLQSTEFSVKCSVEAVLQMLRMVRSARRGVVVCLGELALDGVPPRRYVAEYKKFANSLEGVGPAGMWLPCAHCVARAEEIQGRGRCDDEKLREFCDNRWHRGWP
ncbi:hypothetical protein C8R44DRAFT_755655 [Mycena epipterygia]|nr:hypothetical protein C8R44DRAFT_755655 [Mycena epipterygia]